MKLYSVKFKLSCLIMQLIPQYERNFTNTANCCSAKCKPQTAVQSRNERVSAEQLVFLDEKGTVCILYVQQ